MDGSDGASPSRNEDSIGECGERRGGKPRIRAAATFAPLGEKNPMNASGRVRGPGMGAAAARTEPRPPGTMIPLGNAVCGGTRGTLIRPSDTFSPLEIVQLLMPCVPRG